MSWWLWSPGSIKWRVGSLGLHPLPHQVMVKELQNSTAVESPSGLNIPPHTTQSTATVNVPRCIIFPRLRRVRQKFRFELWIQECCIRLPTPMWLSIEWIRGRLRRSRLPGIFFFNSLPDFCSRFLDFCSPLFRVEMHPVSRVHPVYAKARGRRVPEVSGLVWHAVSSVAKIAV